MSAKSVLMMAYGSPNSLDDMEAYLADIRGGRPTSKAFINEFQERYSLIGGRSPLTDWTFEQARKTEEVLRIRGCDASIYVGMRHWFPWIKDAVGQMMSDGVEEAVGIVMAPHYSSMSIGKYWAKLMEAQKILGSSIRFSRINSWWRQPKLLDAQEASVREGLENFPYEVRNLVKIVFTAHSLPARLIKRGDPYQDELKNNAQMLVDRLGDVDWTFSYQSAAQTGEAWLGPQIEEVIENLGKAGYNQVLVVPIGFVCDHIEVLFDIDISLKKIAKAQGIHLERVKSLNGDPMFIEAVADSIASGFGED